MASEVLQLAIMLLVFIVVFVSWLFIIYIPGRTMEGKWEGDRAERLEEAHSEKEKSRSEKVEPETSTRL